MPPATAGESLGPVKAPLLKQRFSLKNFTIYSIRYLYLVLHKRVFKMSSELNIFTPLPYPDHPTLFSRTSDAPERLTIPTPDARCFCCTAPPLDPWGRHTCAEEAPDDRHFP